MRRLCWSTSFYFLRRILEAPKSIYHSVLKIKMETKLLISSLFAIHFVLVTSVPFPTPILVRPDEYLKLNCRFPSKLTSEQIREVKWSLLHDDLKESRDPVNLDSRVLVDYEGNLHFANVRFTDARAGLTYQCLLKNGESTRYGVDRYELRLQSPPVGQISLESKWTSTTNVTVEAGDVVRMKCIFEGKPTPSIKWYKMLHRYQSASTWRNVTLNSRVSSTGSELIIRRVGPGDEGPYQCQGFNRIYDLGHHTDYYNAPADFEVALKGKPYFQKDITRAYETHGEEEYVTLICVAAGFPQPTLRLVKDHIFQPLVKSYVLPDWSDLSEVRIQHRIAANDSSVYQCLAENVHGAAIFEFTNDDENENKPAKFPATVLTIVLVSVIGVIVLALMAWLARRWWRREGGVKTAVFVGRVEGKWRK